MTLDLMFFAFAVPAVLFSGISKGGFGSSAAFASVPFLAVVLDPITAVALMLPLLMVMDAWNLRAFWRQWDADASTVLICGGVVGTFVGAAIFAVADAGMLSLLIGLVALGFVAQRLTRRVGWLRSAPQPMGVGFGLMWSAIAGFTSMISHAGGPPAAIYLLSRGLDKTTFQATTVVVFTIINIVKLLQYFALGVFTETTLLAGLFLAPVAVIGAVIGVKLHTQVPERPFFAVIYIFLSITGAKLVADYFWAVG